MTNVQNSPLAEKIPNFGSNIHFYRGNSVKNREISGVSGGEKWHVSKLRVVTSRKSGVFSCVKSMFSRVKMMLHTVCFSCFSQSRKMSIFVKFMSVNVLKKLIFPLIFRSVAEFSPKMSAKHPPKSRILGGSELCVQNQCFRVWKWCCTCMFSKVEILSKILGFRVWICEKHEKCKFVQNSRKICKICKFRTFPKNTKNRSFFFNKFFKFTQLGWFFDT